ncbi:MAG: TonB-dependent receptor [Mediterranea sp.]|jgi:outer membrane cobalamin receptor|nr:TonB-dependent receptor [Mediterranea sp.]
MKRYIRLFPGNGGRVLLACCCLTLATSLAARRQRVDTLRTYALPEVGVVDRYHTRETHATAPAQSLSREAMQAMGVLQVSDAVKHFAGVTVKDYGGVGGLKTVSIRSLGAQHTAVGYDGIAITDAQTGQIDIGRFSLDNVDRLSLSNGQSDNIFQPARFFAAAGILNIQTLTPSFGEGKATNAAASFKTGSWGLVNPSVRIERRLGSRWAATANAEWMSVDGHYPYTFRYADLPDAISSREKRANTAVRTLRAEAGLYGNFSDREQWRLKAYYYQSSRGLPNATTLYNKESDQHLWDKNVFVQSHYKREFSHQWVFQASGKWNWSYQRYLDPNTKNSEGKTDNSYRQQEYYLTASALYRALDRLSFALSTDGSVNTLSAGGLGFAAPTRYSWLTALAGKYVDERLTLSASLLATLIREEVKVGGSAGQHRKLSPYVSASLKLLRSEELRVRFFYKDIFRLPSFNDLYYTGVGDIRLKPERARQYNLGLTYAREADGPLAYLAATVDAYHNRVTDKIVAVPTKNLFVWSMKNLGKVDIKGVDLTATIGLRPCRDIRLNLSGNYTYQRALDVTNPDPNTDEGVTYKHQIAYTPRVAASGRVGVETPWVSLTYAFIHAGRRYALGQDIAANRLPGYSDHSLAASRDLKLGKLTATASVEVLNLLDRNYEIIKSFPMPGRSFRATIKLKY